MKPFIAIAVLMTSLVVGAAQEPVPEPEFAEVFVALDSGKLIPLERQTASVQGGGGGFIVASAKVILAFWFGPPGRHWLGFMDGAREA